MIQRRNTQYRKVKTSDSYRYVKSKYPPYGMVPIKTVNKIHGQFKPKGGVWTYLCGKRESTSRWGDSKLEVVPDDVLMTCHNCAKNVEVEALFADKIIARLDREEAELAEIPSLDDFQ